MSWFQTLRERARDIPTDSVGSSRSQAIEAP